MPNSIITNTMRIPFIAEAEANMNLIANGNIQFNKNFVGGSGSTMSVLVPGYGNDVGTGADVTSDISDVVNGERNITLTQYHKALSLTQVNRSLELSSFEDQVAKPFGQKLASDIQTIAADTLRGGAATVTVSTTGQYQDIGTAVAKLESSRATGDLFGIMSPKISKSVVDSGLNFFQADLKNSFLTGDLGKYMGTMFYKSQDIASTIVVGAYTATTVTVASNYTAGSTSLAISGTTLTGTIKKYMSVAVTNSGTSNVNNVDIYGKDTGDSYSVIAQADVLCASNAATLTVLPMYASGPLKNVSRLPVAGDTITIQQAANSTYQSVLVWEKQCFVTASGKIAPLTMVESKATDGKIMNLMTSVGTDAVKGIDVVRWDALLGFTLIYRNRCARLDVKIA